MDEQIATTFHPFLTKTSFVKYNGENENDVIEHLLSIQPAPTPTQIREAFDLNDDASKQGLEKFKWLKREELDCVMNDDIMDEHLDMTAQAERELSKSQN